MAIGKVGQRRQVVIPKDIFEELNMHEGDFIEVQKQKNGVFIKPKKLIDADDTILTPEEAKRVRKGEAELRAGKGIPLAEVKKKLKL